MKVLREQTPLERAQEIYKKIENARTREEYQDAKIEQRLFMMELDRPSTDHRLWKGLGNAVLIGFISALIIWGFIAWVIN